MAISAIAEGGTIPVGNSTTPNTLAFLSTQFLPSQVAVGTANGFNPTVYAAQSLGLALAGTTAFQSEWGSFSSDLFKEGVAGATGVQLAALDGWLTYWTGFYTANPGALHGLSVTQAAYNARRGDRCCAAQSDVSQPADRFLALWLRLGIGRKCAD